MKKQIIGTLLMVLFTIGAYAEKTNVKFTFKGYERGQLQLVALGKQHNLTPNAEKVATLELDVTKASWARLSYFGSSCWLYLYLTPGNDVSVEMDLSGEMKGAPNHLTYPCEVTCNDGGINKYLVKFQKENSAFFGLPFKEEEMSLTGKARADRFDELIKHYENEVDATTIPAEHKPVVKLYTKYDTGNGLLWYIFSKMRASQNYYQDDAYYEKLESLIVDQPVLMGLKTYMDFMKAAVLFSYDRGDLSPLEYTTKAVEKVAGFNGPVKYDIIAPYVMEYVQKHGIEGTEEMQKILFATYPDPRAKDYFNKFLAEYKGLEKGAPSAPFNYPDVNGKMVSLESLKGKFVYIDLWATWCGPCKKEIPFLQKLEHEYAGKDIHFVSISSDKPEDVEKWKAMVKEKNMGGIQLHANGDQEFAKAYKVQGIPRFILLDKEGKIVEINAPRPSSEEIRPLLDQLLKADSELPQGIRFEHGTLAEAFAKAKKENKLVFVDTYTEWCGPCKRLSKEVFPQKKVGDYFNSRFVSLKIDAEKGEGIEYAKKYKIKSYPTLMFLNANGDVMYRIGGFTNADGLINDAKIAVDPSRQLAALQKRYDEGERDLDFMFQLCEELGKKRMMDEIYKIGAAYTKSIEVEQLYDPKVFKMVTWSTKLEWEDEAYQFIYNNWDEIIEKTGVHPMSLERTMRDPAYFYLVKVAKECNSIEDVDKAIEQVKKATKIQDKEKLYAMHYLAKADTDKWYSAQKKRLDGEVAKENNGRMSFYMLQMAKDIDENDVFNGTKMCKKLIKEFTQLEKEYEENFTDHAYKGLVLLYKADGNKKKALEYLEKYKEEADKRFNKSKKGLPDFVTEFIEEIEQM
ncbi:thioredoxin domain-containing protein [Marinifilum sp.]|uniref:thioredoxin domain-containing protein n=1 Tax=Marinifilum sp. TaxID=2033137 RepID=UPI003BAB7DC7